MKIDLFAVYAGPDQIMGLASGIATVVGFLLMFWNKVLVTCGKVVNHFRPLSEGEKASHDEQ